MPTSDVKPTVDLQFFQTEDLKFECTQCGRCCTGKGSYVFITNKESEVIRNHLKLSKSRPLQCHTYPFWPEIMASKKAWESEKSGCEGINRGSVVPVHRILDSLALFADDPVAEGITSHAKKTL